MEKISFVNCQLFLVILICNLTNCCAQETSTSTTTTTTPSPVKYNYTLDELEDVQVPWATSFLHENLTDWFDYFEDLEEKSLSPVAIAYFNYHNVSVENLKGAKGIWGAFNGLAYEPTVTTTEPTIPTTATIPTDPTLSTTSTTTIRTISTTPTTTEASTSTTTEDPYPWIKDYPYIEFSEQSHLIELQYFELKYYTHGNASVSIHLNGNREPTECIPKSKSNEKDITIAEWRVCSISEELKNTTWMKIDLKAHEDGDFVLLDSAIINLMGAVLPTTSPRSTVTVPSSTTETTHDNSSISTSESTETEGSSSTTFNPNSSPNLLKTNFKVFSLVVLISFFHCQRFL